VTPEHSEPALAVDAPPGGGSGGVGPAEAEPARTGGEGPPPKRSRWLVEGAAVVVIAVLVAILLRTFVVQTFFIPSGSMEPTMQIGDRILVNKLSYHLHSVQRGDIVVFSRPPLENCGGPEVNDLVKRVIGLPGDVVSVSGGYVYIDGKRLDESWLPASDQGVTEQGPPGNAYNLAHPYRVPTGDYFVMGDNRTDSCDSRWWGPISKSLIVGKVDLRIWPIGSIKLF
jgi:signal peptidase I